MECNKCESHLMVLIGDAPSQQNYRCRACGAEHWIYVTRVPTEPDGSMRDVGQLLILKARWTGKPRIEQVKLVVKLFPRLQAAGFSAMWRTAVANDPIDLGVFSKEDLEYFMSALQEIGLSTSYELDELSAPLPRRA